MSKIKLNVPSISATDPQFWKNTKQHIINHAKAIESISGLTGDGVTVFENNGLLSAVQNETNFCFQVALRFADGGGQEYKVIRFGKLLDSDPDYSVAGHVHKTDESYEVPSGNWTAISSKSYIYLAVPRNTDGSFGDLTGCAFKDFPIADAKKFQDTYNGTDYYFYVLAEVTKIGSSPSDESDDFIVKQIHTAGDIYEPILSGETINHPWRIVPDIDGYKVTDGFGNAGKVILKASSVDVAEDTIETPTETTYVYLSCDVTEQSISSDYISIVTDTVEKYNIELTDGVITKINVLLGIIHVDPYTGESIDQRYWQDVYEVNFLDQILEGEGIELEDEYGTGLKKVKLSLVEGVGLNIASSNNPNKSNELKIDIDYGAGLKKSGTAPDEKIELALKEGNGISITEETSPGGVEPNEKKIETKIDPYSAVTVVVDAFVDGQGGITIEYGALSLAFDGEGKLYLKLETGS